MVSRHQLLAVSVGALFVSSVQAQTVTIKLGHVAPMTGGQAHYGKDNESGAKLAIADLNKAGLKIDAKPSNLNW